MSLANALGITENEFLDMVSKTKDTVTCYGCKWHDEYTFACCNGDSEYRADFVNCGCELKKEE